VYGVRSNPSSTLPFVPGPLMGDCAYILMSSPLFPLQTKQGPSSQERNCQRVESWKQHRTRSGRGNHRESIETAWALGFHPDFSLNSCVTLSKFVLPLCASCPHL
jgi:hypothetical protein